MESKLGLLFWLLLLHHQRPSMSTSFRRSTCMPGSMEECMKAKFVPGHTLLGEGINIVTMEKTSTFLLDLQEVEKECTICHNPYTDTWEKLPKAMVDWRPEPSCSTNIQSSESRSVVSVAEEATSEVQNDWKVGLNLKFVVNVKTAFGGSHSQVAKFAESKAVTDNYSFLSHKLECVFYSFSLSEPRASLTSHFKAALEELPESYDKVKYRKLIDKYGTHYTTLVRAGGQTKDVTAVRTCEVSMSGMKMDEVKKCLTAEAEIGIFGSSTSSSFKNCKNKLQESGYKGDFYQVFNEYTSRVIGGKVTFDLLSPARATPDAYNKWMESLKTYPGLVSYSVESIHNLVKINGPKKENLRLAISDYIQEKASPQKCSCREGQVVTKGDDCSCECKASGYTGSNCCPTHRGAARLILTIKSATGLKGGDFGSKADGYVIFKFGSIKRQSSKIKNKKDPTWNEKHDLGSVELNPIKSYTIEVWDEDVRNDDLLGKCEKSLTAGDVTETCYLKKGHLTYSLSVTCAHHLAGRFCQDYIPVPPRV
ncbi:perforin-1-like isoform X2 [Hyla sarda]|nr:perforin-1-like isoform X2 [Hyla sarda]XP_056390205.1 perforin-1-like isoform X2 [Hyla sarda]XP_056390206.1 perforin-1-like isoform X2 [Hyla sarda]